MKLDNRKIVILIFLAALIMRLGYFFYLGPLEHTPPDTAYYASSAESLLGGVFPYKSFYGIGYVTFLALIFKIFGSDNFLAVIIAQIIIGSATAALGYCIGIRIYSRFTGIIAGVLIALMPLFIFWTRYILTETLFLFSLTLFVWSLIKFLDTTHLKYTVLSFAIFVGMISIKIATLFLVPFILFWILLAQTDTKWIIYKRIAIIIAVICLLCLPYVLSNFVITEEIVQHPRTFIDKFQHSVTKGLQWNEQGRATVGIDIGPRSEWAREAREFKGDISRMTNLMWRKLKSFWWLYTPEMSIRHRLIRVFFLVPVYIFGIIGICLGKKVWQKITLLLILVLGFTLPPLLTVVDYDLRYHLPVELLCIIISAYGAGAIWKKTCNQKECLSHR